MRSKVKYRLVEACGYAAAAMLCIGCTVTVPGTGAPVESNGQGYTGVVTDMYGTATSAMTSDNDSAKAVAIQSDGKIVVAGASESDDRSRSSFLVARYNANGSADTTFGTSGRVVTPLGTDASRARAIAIQDDGRILVAGGANQSGSTPSITIARFLSNGSLDATFGTAGVQTLTIGTGSAAGGIAIQKDGKIVVAGTATVVTGPLNLARAHIVVARFTSAGALDTSASSGFGPVSQSVRQGYVTTTVNNRASTGNAVAIDAGGNIVVAGTAVVGVSNIDFAVARYKPNGDADTAFAGGAMTLSFGATSDIGTALAIQPDNRIVVAGTTGEGPAREAAIARIAADGTIDASFGGGKIMTSFGGANGGAAAIVVDKNSKIVVGGGTFSRTTGVSFAMERYNADGSADATFAGTGRVVTQIGESNNTGSALALGSDGTIVLAGNTFRDRTSYDFAIARYTGDGALDTSFGGHTHPE